MFLDSLTATKAVQSETALNQEIAESAREFVDCVLRARKRRAVAARARLRRAVLSKLKFLDALRMRDHANAGELNRKKKI